MEYNKVEVALVEETALEATDSKIRELSELQITLIGGGIGDAIGF